MSGSNINIRVELTPELATFVLENCDANLQMALRHLQSMSPDLAVKMVDTTEKFKALRAAVLEAGGTLDD